MIHNLYHWFLCILDMKHHKFHTYYLSKFLHFLHIWYNGLQNLHTRGIYSYIFGIYSQHLKTTLFHINPHIFLNTIIIIIIVNKIKFIIINKYIYHHRRRRNRCRLYKYLYVHILYSYLRNLHSDRNIYFRIIR